MYINVYIFGMEMSQRIHFWYQILLKMTIWGEIHFWYQFLLKMTIFGENGKKILLLFFFLKKILGQPTKHNFELKMLKLLENQVTAKA